jgi:hypothetical protein
MIMKAFRIILSSILVCLAVLIFDTEVKAQESLKSQIVTEYDGKPYYIHTVKKKQTLKEIADIYGVAVYDIIKENKGVKTTSNVENAPQLIKIEIITLNNTINPPIKNKVLTDSIIALDKISPKELKCIGDFEILNFEFVGTIYLSILVQNPSKIAEEIAARR